MGNRDLCRKGIDNTGIVGRTNDCNSNNNYISDNNNDDINLLLDRY